MVLKNKENKITDKERAMTTFRGTPITEPVEPASTKTTCDSKTCSCRQNTRTSEEHHKIVTNNPLEDPTDREAREWLADKLFPPLTDPDEPNDNDLATYLSRCQHCSYETSIRTTYTKDTYAAPCSSCGQPTVFTILSNIPKDLKDKPVEALGGWYLKADDIKEVKPGGTKYDEDKLRYDLLPPQAIAEVIKVLTKGAEKYGAYNWAKGIKFSRLYAAAQRHLQAWHNLEDNDPETGINHLAHAMCSLIFLLTFQQQKNYRAEMLDLDDRYNYKTPQS